MNLMYTREKNNPNPESENLEPIFQTISTAEVKSATQK